MARLIREHTTVELPRPAPGIAIVILLAAAEPHAHCPHDDLAKTPRIERTPQSLDRGAVAKLFDDEQPHSSAIAREDHLVRVLYTQSDRFLDDDVLAIRRYANRMLRVIAGWRENV